MEADEELACPVAMGNPDPQVVERVTRRERERASRRKAKDNGRLCFLLGKELPSSRLENRQWCSCGSCVTFTTIRENVCCREALEEGRGNEALKGLREKLKESGQCIVHHPSFYKVAQDPEVPEILCLPSFCSLVLRALRLQQTIRTSGVVPENYESRMMSLRAPLRWAIPTRKWWRGLRGGRERASRRKAKDNGRLCFLLGKELPSSRLENRQWCSCGSCVTFTTIRENVCCREALEEGRGNEALKGLREKLKESGQCIVHHPSFYKVAQDPEVTFQFFRCLRYCAYRAFVAWCYGHLGFSKRYELPACARGAIIKTFPSSSGVYVGFKVVFTCSS
ncbi:hypothetical protein COOONC_12671 [Cooperia oncophora]